MKHLFLFLVLVFPISAFAAVPMQTTQDRAENGRLIIDGKKRFISGMNIAWNSFAHDVGDGQVNISAFVSQFKQIEGAGGNAVRWWLHTDNEACPKLNSNGEVTGLGSKTIDNIRQVLDSAYNHGIVVSLTLFSFDLLKNDNNKTAAQMSANKKFLTVPANLDTYIEKGLKPILAAVGNHPAIMCWEVFNEPEGMSSDAGGWANEKVPMSDILRFTARIAAVVHDKTLKMASTGIHEYGKMKTWYSDAKLRAAAGSDPLASKAYLDFYMAHYYPEYIGTSGSPFHHPASYWSMDRPILIGEFPAQSWNGSNGYGSIQSGTAMTINDAYLYAYNNGYCGLMSWSMTEGEKNKFGSFSTTEPALRNLYNDAARKADIDGVPVSGGGGTSSSSVASSSSVISSSSSATSSSSAVVSSSSRASSSSAAVSSSSSRAAASSSSRASSSSVAVSSSSSRAAASSSSVDAISSSSNSEDTTSSSSSEDATPITSHSPLATSHSPTYYSLKGEPLGNAKPQKAGVYIVKQGHSVKKIVVRQ